MTYAVIRSGGKQYRVKENDILTIEKLPGQAGESVVFNEVLLISDESGENVKIGNPIIDGAKVEAKILEQFLGKKVSVVKYKPKVRYKRRVGHRQMQTKVKIEKVAA